LRNASINGILSGQEGGAGDVKRRSARDVREGVGGTSVFPWIFEEDWREKKDRCEREPIFTALGNLPDEGGENAGKSRKPNVGSREGEATEQSESPLPKRCPGQRQRRVKFRWKAKRGRAKRVCEPEIEKP